MRHKISRPIAVVQARLGSTRLPGKVMMPMAGIPMIEILLRRLLASTLLDGVVLATGSGEQNNPLQKITDNLGIALIRGSEDDVLSRFILASEELQASSIIRITGDNPLTSIVYMEKLVQLAVSKDLDYAGTTALPTGMGSEWVEVDALLRSADEMLGHPDEKRFREHVTLWIREDMGSYKKGYIEGPGNGNLSLTVDTAEEFNQVCSFIEGCGKKPEKIDIEDVWNGIENGRFKQ